MDKQEAIKILKEFHDTSALFSVRTALETVFPELKEDEFNKEIEHLNWNSILKFMNDTNWQWCFYDSVSNYRVPTKEEMVERLREDFLKHALYHIIELRETHYAIFSGGFNAELGYIDDNYWVNIYFDIAHFWEDEL